jgi:hypothetical protein
MSTRTTRRLAVAVAAVQVIGLSRWFLLVPGISRDATDPAKTADAHHAFELAHTWLGTVSGSTPPASPTSPATSPGASG